MNYFIFNVGWYYLCLFIADKKKQVHRYACWSIINVLKRRSTKIAAQLVDLNEHIARAPKDLHHACVMGARKALKVRLSVIVARHIFVSEQNGDVLSYCNPASGERFLATLTLLALKTLFSSECVNYNRIKRAKGFWEYGNILRNLNTS